MSITPGTSRRISSTPQKQPPASTATSNCCAPVVAGRVAPFFSFMSRVPHYRSLNVRSFGVRRKARPRTLHLAQWSERRANLPGEDFRLFPRREVAAFVEPAVIDELGISSLRPRPRGCIDLIRKDAHGNRDRDVFRGEKGELVLPVETGRRNPRVRQPVECDVV